MGKKIWLILLLLLITTNAWAVSARVRYSNASCPNNGNGTAQACAASPGAAGAYNSVSNALAGESGDLVSADVYLDVQVEGTTADTTCIDTGTGFTTDATRFIQVRTTGAYRHAGVWSTSYPTISASCNYYLVYIREAFVRLDGLQLDNTYTAGNSSGVSIVFPNEANSVRVENCLIKHSGSLASGDFYGISVEADYDAASPLFRNNIIYDWDQGIRIKTTNTGVGYAYSNTSYGNTYGLVIDYRTGSTLNVKNNILYGNTTADYYVSMDGGTLNTATNLTSDATSPNNALDSKTLTFVNAAGRNLHLAATDTDAIDVGTDLSAEAAPGGYTTDIDGVTRTGTWDVGADEYVAAATDILPLLHATEE